MQAENVIKEKHAGDIEQLKFIFSDENRIIVTAPAGCGKTTAIFKSQQAGYSKHSQHQKLEEYEKNNIRFSCVDNGFCFMHRPRGYRVDL